MSATEEKGSFSGNENTSHSSLSPEDRAAIERSARFKIDLLLMPILVIMFIFNYLDRSNIASANLANIVEDLGMTQMQYQCCISLLFVGYILMQVPSNMVIAKITRPAWYLCGAMAVWGGISCATGAVQNFAGLVTCRFFLGFVEAVFFPGALYYLSVFYTRNHYALRAAILYVGAQLGNAFGGLFAVAILEMDGLAGLEGWRWLFIIEGVVTVVLALGFALVMPDRIQTCRWLTETERAVYMESFVEDQGQDDKKEEITSWQGFVLAVKDPKTWILIGTMHCLFVAASVTNFFPSVVRTLGYNRAITYVLTAPPYMFACVVMLLNGFHSDRKKERYLHIVLPLTITVAANAIALGTRNVGARYFAMMLLPASFYGSLSVLLSWVSNSLTQPVAKRAAGIAFVNAMCNSANIWTAFLYRGAPGYHLAFSVNLGASVLSILFATLMRYHLKRQNAKLEKGEDTGASGPTKEQKEAGFRYLL